MSVSVESLPTVRTLDAAAYRSSLSVRDLTDAAWGPHAMQLLVQHAIAALRSLWSCEAVVYRAPALVSVASNYDELQYPIDGASRDARYTRYVTSSQLLRTQTSAMIPSALRMLVDAQYEDVVIACPGLTYRRDTIDRLHVGEPHQLDLWRIVRGAMTRRDLEEMVRAIAGVLLPGAELRLDPATHPYTQEGLEVHARVGGRWVEILECGLAAPAVLSAAGLNADYSGLAMGMGLDRILMLRKGIDDIRTLRSDDPRIVRQLLDLEPWRPVSSQPAMQRDLSIAIARETTAEEIGDRVRAALGERSYAVEEISVVSETTWLDLSVAARRRLGMTSEQKNVLLRLVIRDVSRTLTSMQANELRDAVYAALHEGAVATWASRESI